ncbi:hypothetical protein E4L95_01010 [Paracoccus liaowanqingii]|uniref:Replication protein n=1 Tax=Paracoccus liaowanqingii TaxID=2560053 RepID=A0A4Z1CST5_9RHOB|nr:hypothetical protein [Paracoccus liaowanqingii]TGN68563.1 hypothetical protein E4L95_01010 [Paracoccus liaowanqingii]
MSRRNASTRSLYSLTYLPWDRLSPAERNREIVLYAERHRGGAVTLNLKPETEALLHGQQHPMRVVSKRMNAELNRLDLRQLPVMMVLEATRPEGRLHLHGVCLTTGYSSLLIQKAMRRAVGCVEGRRGSRQFKAQPIYAADGWMKYLSKDCRWTARLLGELPVERLWWVSHAMTQIVRDDYEAQRLGLVETSNTNCPMLIAS